MRKIIHIDMDCFFAAVEMREDPALASVPLAIGGAAERRGVISTCNYVARRFGIHSAMATAHARRLCPELVVLPGRMALYQQVSRFRTGSPSALRVESPVVEDRTVIGVRRPAGRAGEHRGAVCQRIRPAIRLWREREE